MEGNYTSFDHLKQTGTIVVSNSGVFQCELPLIDTHHEKNPKLVLPN